MYAPAGENVDPNWSFKRIIFQHRHAKLEQRKRLTETPVNPTPKLYYYPVALSRNLVIYFTVLIRGKI